MSAKSRILNILFWSVISAAFIGPGTITTAAKSGAAYGTSLLWALLFSTLACLILQEAASRISIVTGRNLGQSIAAYFGNSRFRSLVLLLILGAILIGSAAYEMGNLMGAVAGLKLITDIPSYLLIFTIAVSAALLLSIPSLKVISTILGILVVIMGMGFLITAVMVRPGLSQLLSGTIIPSFPGPQAGTLVLALIGTTIVPYNLFLGSGLSSSAQSIREMRFGLTVAIVLGGIFSMAVLVVGSAISGTFSFEALASVLQAKIGNAGKYLLGFGLFAAGFTSAVTAPLATAITLKSLFGQNHPEKWKEGKLRFSITWLFVLAIGTVFASLDIKPVPAIIVAQALNGFLLPFISIFLFIVFMKNMRKEKPGPGFSDILMLAVILITLIIGFSSATKAVAKVFTENFEHSAVSMIIICLSSLLIVVILGRTTINSSFKKI